MTTLWKPAGEWQGETVAVLGTGPSMGAEAAEALACHKTIAVNHAGHLVAPWADMLVSVDGNWPQEYRDFVGIRVTGVADDGLDALYIGPCWETVNLGPGHTIEIRNSGLAAIRVAAGMGASKIILAGFDHPKQSGHFYEEEPVQDAGEPYIGLAQAMDVLLSELQARGIEVERV